MSILGWVAVVGAVIYIGLAGWIAWMLDKAYDVERGSAAERKGRR